MRALVLTAGLGTRLRPLTYVRAKAAVPVNSEPLACRVIRWLGGHGISDVVLNLHHHPATIAAVVGDGADLGARVRYSWEQPILGSAGGPRHALALLGPDTFLVVNGDTLTDVDVPRMVAAHRSSRAAITMALIPNPRPEQYGGVIVTDGWVTGFTRPGATGPSYHFIGVQVAEPRVFAPLPDGVPEESVGRLYPKLMAENARSVAAFISDAAFQDIGTPRDYLDTCIALAALEGDRLGQGTGIKVADSAELTRTAVWDDVVIGAGARLDECILCDGVHIPDRTRYVRCAIVAAAGLTAAKDERIEGDLLIRPL